MKSVEKTGKTIEDAVALAVQELGVDISRVDVQVLENPAKGLFGIIGTRLGKVRVTVKKVDPIEAAKKFLQDILDKMGLAVRIETFNGDVTTINLWGDDLGILIGKHGQTLDALQYLINLVANKHGDHRVRILLDVEDYRRRRTDTLKNLALRLAERVRRRGDEIALEPMTPQERKIIHMALQDNPYVYTVSEGDEPFRKIVICARK
ncbi:MAG TPA: RNA-binding cell elongation regulator Jag/EloR [Negativicutes bacterium]|nr:RNA-binding cell elongation regulator Jag/EloR [Negativicutes bacterium]